MEPEAFLVYVPINSQEKAQELAKKMVEKRLCACTNIIPKIYSTYWWNGEVTQDMETVIIFKTLKPKLQELYEEIEKEHPYTVPAILTIPILKVNTSYLQWMKNELGIQ